MSGIPTEFDVRIDRRQIVAWVLVLLAVIVLGFPFVQTIGYRVLVATPSVLQWGVVGGLVMAAGWFAGSGPTRILVVLAGVVIIVVMGFVVGPVVGGIYAHEHVAHEMVTESASVHSFPNSSADHVRVLPRQVADQYAQSSLQYPQYRVSGSDITYTHGGYAWSYALVPDNPLVALFGHQKGAVYVDMEQSSKRVTIRETPFRNGIGQLFTDSHEYRTALDRIDVDRAPATRFVFEKNGKAYIAQSYVTHEWHFRLTPLPQLYAVPRFGGVQVMDQSGHIRDVPAKKVADSPLLRGQNVYPYWLVRYRVRSVNYRHGALNKWFWKRDVLELAALPSTGNDWPVTVPTESDGGPQLTYFVATEPTGSGSGVYEVWTFDSQTGAASVVRYDQAQIGPAKATKFIRQNRDVARLNDVQAVEPIPVVRGDTLYWQVSVIPTGSNGITYTGFVNADTGKTILVSKTDRVRAFVTGRGINVTAPPGGGSENASHTTVTVVVTNGDGQVVSRSNVTVPAGGSVNVQVRDNSTASNATAQG